MAHAWRMVDWALLNEVNKEGGEWKDGQPLRISALNYARFYSSVEPERARGFEIQIARTAGRGRAARVCGLYKGLLGLAKDKKELPDAVLPTRRGWILDRLNQTMGPRWIAEELQFEPDQVREDLLILKKCGLIEIAECAFAVEDEYPMSMETAGAKPPSGVVGDEGGLFATNPAALYNRNQNGNLKENLIGIGSSGAAEEAPIRASSAAVPNGPAGGEPRGLPVRGPEETEPRPKAEDREDESRAEEEPNAEPMTQPNGPRTESREAEEPKSRAGAADRQGASARQIKETISEPYQPDPNEPGLKDQPDGKPTSQKYGPGGSLLPWDIDALEVMREDPRRCLLEGLSPNPRYAREQVIDRALGWCKKLLPQLEPPLGASDYARQEARKDAACIENRLVEAWDREGGGELICLLIADLQKILRTLQQRGNRGRGENNVMKIWVSNCRKLHGLGLKPSPSSPPP